MHMASSFFSVSLLLVAFSPRKQGHVRSGSFFLEITTCQLVLHSTPSVNPFLAKLSAFPFIHKDMFNDKVCNSKGVISVPFPL